MNFTAFRIVEAYFPYTHGDYRDDLLHLVYNARDLHTICQRDVAGMTLLRLRDFGRPCDDVQWCPRCASRLRTLEDRAFEIKTNRHLSRTEETDGAGVTHQAGRSWK